MNKIITSTLIALSLATSMASVGNAAPQPSSCSGSGPDMVCTADLNVDSGTYNIISPYSSTGVIGKDIISPYSSTGVIGKDIISPYSSTGVIGKDIISPYSSTGVIGKDIVSPYSS